MLYGLHREIKTISKGGLTEHHYFADRTNSANVSEFLRRYRKMAAVIIIIPEQDYNNYRMAREASRGGYNWGKAKQILDL